MKFVVSNTCRLGLELIKGNSLIAIRKILDFERVCIIIHKNGRVSAKVHKVDDILVHILIIAADSVIPTHRLIVRPERLDELAGPHLGKDADPHNPRWGKITDSRCSHGNTVRRHCAGCRVKACNSCDCRTRYRVECDTCNEP